MFVCSGVGFVLRVTQGYARGPHVVQGREEPSLTMWKVSALPAELWLQAPRCFKSRNSIEMLVLGPDRSDIEGDKPCSEGHREPAFPVHDASKGVFLAPDTRLG